MAKLLSVNVGLPRDVQWKGRTVHTAVWKSPLPGRCRVRRLNVDGDGQGDLGGHGGEQRAVFVYQIESYRYWQDQLGRSDFVYGQFGENFTVQGLPDAAVCVGDRYRIGTALFEVTQPRVTCYRVGIRTNEPRMPALLTSSGRPGFYMRVLREGDVGAGDDIEKLFEAGERMTIMDVNALLYSSRHPVEQLKRVLRIDALSPGWRWSFDELLRNAALGTAGGNAGLAPAAARQVTAPGFVSLRVEALQYESADVLSLTLQSAGGKPLPPARPGQYVVLRLPPAAGVAPLLRSYSLSGAASSQHYRISVKIEARGAAGIHLRDHVRAGDLLDVSLPRGSFLLQDGDGPVVFLSAGIGVTPVLAMLHALAAAHSTRPVLWLHGARDGQHHPFAAETRSLLDALPQGSSRVYYSRPGLADRLGQDFDAAGRLSPSALGDLDLPAGADVYLCGPDAFMAQMKEALAARNVPPQRIHAEVFSGRAGLTPGIAAVPTRAPHVPDGVTDAAPSGPLVSFARSGIAVHWKDGAWQNILELAEACDVPVRWSCRAGVCHNCESGLVSGDVAYEPDPLDPPAQGNVLICCARPAGDVVIDV